MVFFFWGSPVVRGVRGFSRRASRPPCAPPCALPPSPASRVGRRPFLQTAVPCRAVAVFWLVVVVGARRRLVARVARRRSPSPRTAPHSPARPHTSRARPAAVGYRRRRLGALPHPARPAAVGYRRRRLGAPAHIPTQPHGRLPSVLAVVTQTSFLGQKVCIFQNLCIFAALKHQVFIQSLTLKSFKQWLLFTQTQSARPLALSA